MNGEIEYVFKWSASGTHVFCYCRGWCKHNAQGWVKALRYTISVPVLTHWFDHIHDDVIKWKHFPRYWPFVRGIHRSPVNTPHKGQWRGALMFTLICARINGWVNNREAGDLRRYRAHYDVIVMKWKQSPHWPDKCVCPRTWPGITR